jgi:uncharacterized membrane-anchored protein YitT (DUF2179 family)
MENTKNKSLIKQINFYTILVLIAALRAVASYIFIVPNNFTVGGVNGIAIIVNIIVANFNATLASSIFNPGIFAFVLNLPIIVLALIKLNKKIAFHAFLSVTVYAVVFWLIEFVNMPQFLAPDKNSVYIILAVVVGALLQGIALGVSLNLVMSAGGAEIIARLVHKRKKSINIQWLILIFDSVVIVLSGLIGIFSIEQGMDASTALVLILGPIMFSCLLAFIKSKVADVLITGVDASVVFNIITKKPNEVSEVVVHKMHRSATILTGEGYYTHEDKKIVVVVVSRKQYVTFRQLVKNIDPDAFMYVTNAKEVHGRGFKSNG